MGRLLTVRLETGDCSFQDFPEEAVRYFGGRGFNVWHLYRNLPRVVSPLSPENILLFSCGLLTGSPAPASSRLHVNALSPLTGILGSSNVGGYAGPWLRSCDIASLIITGRAPGPVYLYVDESGPRLEDASDLWGSDAFETQDRLRAIHGNERLQVLTIGPGGENGVRFAAVISGRDHAAGRTGMGSVMGAKNLKAIAIKRGTHTHFKNAGPEGKQAVRAYLADIKGAAEFKTFSTYGGAGYVQWANDFGILGARNYSRIGLDEASGLDGRKLADNVVKKSGCYGCPVQCKAHLAFESEKGKTFTRPEFEPILNLGPKCGLDDLERIVKLDNLCSRLGLDITSTASVIAFAMDLYAENKLPLSMTDGLDLTWGNAEAMETLIYRIAAGEGLGRILGQGVRRSAEWIGNGADDQAAHVKGLELTAYHPAAIMGTALGYAVSSRGGDYNNVYASLEYSWSRKQALEEFGDPEAVNIKSINAKGLVIKKAVTTNIIVDSLGLCKVPVLSLLGSFNLEKEARLVSELTGRTVTSRELSEIGREIASMEKLFNIRHSPEAEEDSLPHMFMGKDDKNGLDPQDLKSMLAEYYAAMGWNKNGIPDSVGMSAKH